MTPVPLFVELCAGLASVSGVLQHGSTWKPPVSRMGRKTGYSRAILAVMGLRPRQNPERYLWAEADGDVAALLAAYTQPEVMREIAAIIRSWIPCPYGPHVPDPSCSRCKGTGRWDARDLWKVLRREERRGLWEGGGEAGEVAGALVLLAQQDRSGGFNAQHIGSPGQRRPYDIATTAQGCTALPWPPVLLAQDAAVSPEAVAAWAWFHSNTDQSKLDGRAAEGWTFRRLPEGAAETLTRATLADRLDAGLEWPPVDLAACAGLAPANLPAGSVVYLDPPYAGTTGYRAEFSREDVCTAAERWATAGARVYISEAEPVSALGWHEVEITSERIGQARTFGGTREFLTCSHPPAWRPVAQAGLFGRAA